MKRNGEHIVPVTVNPYLKKQCEDRGRGAAAATWNRSFPPDNAVLATTTTTTTTIALPTATESVINNTLTTSIGDPPAHAQSPLHSPSAVKVTPKDRRQPFAWIPQSKLITFGSAEIVTVSEVADLLRQQDSDGRDVRVTGIWCKQETTTAGDEDADPATWTTTTTTTHWLQDPLADFSSTTTKGSRIPIRNLEESFARPRVYEEGRDSTLVTIFGRIVDGAYVQARLSVVVQSGGMHMGLYTRALRARRAALEGQSSACTQSPTSATRTMM